MGCFFNELFLREKVHASKVFPCLNNIKKSVKYVKSYYIVAYEKRKENWVFLTGGWFACNDDTVNKYNDSLVGVFIVLSISGNFRVSIFFPTNLENFIWYIFNFYETKEKKRMKWASWSQVMQNYVKTVLI